MPHEGTPSMCPNHRISQIGDKKRAQFTAVQRSLNQNGRPHAASSRNWPSPTKNHHPEMGIFTHRVMGMNARSFTMEPLRVLPSIAWAITGTLLRRRWHQKMLQPTSRRQF
ncbi:hypothetical protein TWF718_007223 [Orbilia javanica]|uniref:Uncharacterized protein n=1 Tax=Orbilia javanica TaxID=47235 RepID=A0AAN8MP46_9PEZI